MSLASSAVTEFRCSYSGPLVLLANFETVAVLSCLRTVRDYFTINRLLLLLLQCCQSPGAVWKSRWTSWAPVPKKPAVSVDLKQHSTNFNAALRPHRPHGLLGTGSPGCLPRLSLTQLVSSDIRGFNVALRPQRPYGLLRTGSPGPVHLDFHTASEL